MSGPTSFLGRVWENVVRGLSWFTIVIFAVLVFDVLWGVFSRFILQEQGRWTEELAIYLLVWASLFGGALTFRDHGHLGVDYFVGKLDPAAQRFAAIVAELCVLAFAGFALVYGGYRLVSQTLAAGQTTPAMGWKIGYLYSAVPICGVFVVAFCLEHLFARQASETKGGES